jgi:carbon-monoxide dehydrogenase large subunit
MIFMVAPGVRAAARLLACSQGADYRSSDRAHANKKTSMNIATLIGQPVHRAEDLRFLKGAGAFVDDMQREGMLHAVIVRSSEAHGRIRSIDATAARAMAGVEAVLTAADIGAVPVIPLRLANLPEFKSYLQPVIAKDKVRYVGEPVAVVVARTQALAEDAASAVLVDVERLPPLPDRHAAARDASLLFEAAGSNRAVR